MHCPAPRPRDASFHRFTGRLRRRLFSVLLLLNLANGLLQFASLDSQHRNTPLLALVGVSTLLLHLSFLLLLWAHKHWLHSPRTQSLAALAVFLSMLTAHYAPCLLSPPPSPRPVFFLLVSTQTLLPLPRPLLSALCCLLVVGLEACLSPLPPLPAVAFYALSALVAFYLTWLLQLVNRRAFREHRKWEEAKWTLRAQREQQERLLRACLPEHERGLRRHMLARLPLPPHSPSVQQYWGVAILYADIVNSMLLAQTHSPECLVRTLHALVTRFDRLAQLHRCVRIRLLGDCYFCVSGIGQSDRNSGLRCFLLALHMLQAVSSMRPECGTHLDIRIGLHSGSVLSGLLGLRKWTLDVWSADTQKTARLEQEGQAGWIHTTPTILHSLPDSLLRLLRVTDHHVLPGETTFLVRRAEDTPHCAQLTRLFLPGDAHLGVTEGTGRGQHSRRLSQEDLVRHSLTHAIDRMSFALSSQYKSQGNSIHPFLLYFVASRATATRLCPLPPVHLVRETLFATQADPLLPHYLLACVAFAAGILLLRWLGEGHSALAVFVHGTDNLACVAALLVTLASLAHSALSAHPASLCVRFLQWFCLSSLLVSCTLLSPPTGPLPYPAHYTHCCLLALGSIFCFVRLGVWPKWLFSTASLATHLVRAGWRWEWHWQSLLLAYLLLHTLDRQVDYLGRLHFLWAHRLRAEHGRVRRVRTVNRMLLHNILPAHVTRLFLDSPGLFYFESHPACAVMFASVAEWAGHTGASLCPVQHMLTLHRILVAFDQLLLLPPCRGRVEKIKSMGSTYMAAAGLGPGPSQSAAHLSALVGFGMGLMKVLRGMQAEIRRSSRVPSHWPTFDLRVGVSVGPVIAGVVGSLRPQYDLWGDTVNVASRMESQGVKGKVHLPAQVASLIAEHDLFRVYSRGVLPIKGKGQMETCLIDYDPRVWPE